MKTLALIFSLVALAGCAATAVKSSKSEYLSGSAPAAAKAEDIRSDLARGAADNGPGDPLGTVYVEAWPYTEPLVEAQVKDLANKNSDSPEEMKQKMAEQKKLLLSRSCFMIAVRSRDIDHAQFKWWRVKIRQGGKQQELQLMNVNGVASVPDVSEYASYHFLNTSGACVNGKVNFASEFELILVPQYEAGHPVTLTWSKSIASK